MVLRRDFTPSLNVGNCLNSRSGRDNTVEINHKYVFYVFSCDFSDFVYTMRESDFDVEGSKFRDELKRDIPKDASVHNMHIPTNNDFK